MATRLEVLVVESERGAADEAVGALREAGHVVHRCHEDGGGAFPCAALDDRSRCPVEGRGVDVALTVRSRPRSQPAPLEDGLTCAIKHSVPVVVAGRPALHPYERFATEVVEGEDGVVAAVERAAVAELVRHGDAARGSLAQLLELHGQDPTSGEVSVRRRLGGLAVSITLPPGLERRTADMAAVRVVGALRAVDPDAVGIDVTVG